MKVFDYYRFVLILLLCITTQLSALTIKGKITDKEGNPLISATVLIPELKTGAVTDTEGYFILPSIPMKQVTLVETLS